MIRTGSASLARRVWARIQRPQQNSADLFGCFSILLLHFPPGNPLFRSPSLFGSGSGRSGTQQRSLAIDCLLNLRQLTIIALSIPFKTLHYFLVSEVRQGQSKDV